MNTSMILTEKQAKRAAALQVVTGCQDPRVLGSLDAGPDRPLSALPLWVPIFFMFGRLDVKQKGADALLRVIECFPRGVAKFVLALDILKQQCPFVKDLRRVAQWCRGDLIVFPFRMQEGFRELIAGASWALFPSNYESWGGITEPYGVGTPVVARAVVGSFTEQVIDLDDPAGNPTGLLYRESPPDGIDFAEQWSRILDATHPDERMTIPLYRAQVAALRDALLRASAVYRERPNEYARLLANVHDKALSFAWQPAVDQYMTLYQAAMA